MDGWIKLHRKIQDHWIYQEKRKFSRYEAWLDMIMMANHKNNKFLHGNELVEVERGQFITSELKLMERWDWGKNKLRLFLDLLEKDGMIIKKTDHKRTAITICNYGLYHDSETEDGPQPDQSRTDGGPSADTNKNVKNVKNKRTKELKDNTAFEDYTSNPTLIESLESFIEYRKKIKKPMTDKAIKLLLGNLDKLASDDEDKIAILNQSILNGWQGVFPLKDKTNNNWKSFGPSKPEIPIVEKTEQTQDVSEEEFAQLIKMAEEMQAKKGGSSNAAL